MDHVMTELSLLRGQTLVVKQSLQRRHIEIK